MRRVHVHGAFSHPAKRNRLPVARRYLSRSSPAARRPRRGFTLVEILIAVVILGILAAIVIPQFSNWHGTASQVAFITDLRIYNDAAEYYMNVTGEFLEDSGSGRLPAEWETFVNEAEWTAGTPIGGVWDFELDSFGVKSAFGVHFMNGPRQDDTFMAEVDAIVDDGDLAADAFRKIASDRYYLIVRED